VAWLLTQSQGIACDNAGNYAAVGLIVVDNIQFSKALKEIIDSDRMEFARRSLSLEDAFLCHCNESFHSCHLEAEGSERAGKEYS
jgi:hypothetical protein